MPEPEPEDDEAPTVAGIGIPTAGKREVCKADFTLPEKNRPHFTLPPKNRPHFEVPKVK